MPYNGSGTYTPPAADFPAVTQTVISSTKFNNILNDVAAALTNAVTRDGQSPMTAALPMGGWPINAVALGTAAAPSINFSGASTTGFFATAGALGFSVAGVERARFDNSNGLGIGTVSPVSGAGLTIGNDSLGSAIVKASFSTTGTERASVQLNGASGEMRLTAGYLGYGGFLTIHANGQERARFDNLGNFAFGTTNAGTSGFSLSQSFNLSWEQSASESIATIFRQVSSAALVLANGYKRSGTINGFASSFASSWARTAISLGTVTGGITFYTDAATAVAVGTDITPTERMRLDASGNLGIGVTPSYRFDVLATGTESGQFRTSGASNALYLADGGTTGGSLYVGTVGNDFRVVTGSTERMRITATGDVGIGTVGPVGRFAVVGLGGVQVVIDSDANRGWVQSYGSKPLQLNPIGNDIAMCLAGGNVGIGTASPVYRLDVVDAGGNALRFGTSTVQMGGFVSAGLPYFGSISNHSLALMTNSVERMRITGAGNIVAGASAALATTATDGFLYVPTCAGTPTGTPTAITGMAPIVVNTTNNKLYFYSGGAWRDAGP